MRARPLDDRGALVRHRLRAGGHLAHDVRAHRHHAVQGEPDPYISPIPPSYPPCISPISPRPSTRAASYARPSTSRPRRSSSTATTTTTTTTAPATRATVAGRSRGRPRPRRSAARPRRFAGPAGEGLMHRCTHRALGFDGYRTRHRGKQRNWTRSEGGGWNSEGRTVKRRAPVVEAS